MNGKRYYMQMIEYGYWNIYEYGRKNQWGERWCEACYLCEYDARKLLEKLNAS